MKNLAVCSSFADDDWYLCHVTLLAPEEELLSWAMYPYPYLARVDPDARKGTLVYRLAARYSNSENTSAGVSYTLIAGRSSLKEVVSFCKPADFSYRFPILSFQLIDFTSWEILMDTAGEEGGGALRKIDVWMGIFLALPDFYFENKWSLIFFIHSVLFYCAPVKITWCE